MRSRNIKPSFFTNEDLAALTPLARLMFQGLWCAADCEGRLEYRPKRLKMQILPWDDFNVEETLRSLHDAGFIRIYEVDGAKYIHVVNFKKHQTPHIKERKKGSSIPAPDQTGTGPRLVQDQSDTGPELTPDQPESFPADSGFLIPDSGLLNPEPPISPPVLAEAETGESQADDDPGPKLPYGAYFESFWSAYPRKASKGQAWRAWEKLRRSKVLPPVTTLIAAIEAQARSPAWLKNGGEFIPYPATWLNAHGWLNETEPSTPPEKDYGPSGAL